MGWVPPAAALAGMASVCRSPSARGRSTARSLGLGVRSSGAWPCGRSSPRCARTSLGEGAGSLFGCMPCPSAGSATSASKRKSGPAPAFSESFSIPLLRGGRALRARVHLRAARGARRADAGVAGVRAGARARRRAGARRARAARGARILGLVLVLRGGAAARLVLLVLALALVLAFVLVLAVVHARPVIRGGRAGAGVRASRGIAGRGAAGRALVGRARARTRAYVRAGAA